MPLSARIKLRVWHLAVLVLYAAGILAILRVLLPEETSLRGRWLLLATALALTPPHLVGPVWAVLRCSHRGELFAGEVLWAWLGVAWGMLMLPVTRNYDRFIKLGVLTVLLTIAVTIFGLQPPVRKVFWAHRFGWALLVCDMLFFGFARLLSGRISPLL